MAVDPTILDRCLAVLRLYGQTYGIPPTPEQRQGIAATVLRLLQEAVPIDPALGEAMLTWASTAWEEDQPAETNLLPPQKPGSPSPLGAVAPLEASMALLRATGIDFNPAALAQTVHDWHQYLQQQIQETLVNYVQHYGPLSHVPRLEETVLTLLPLLTDGDLTSAEVRGILRETLGRFDLATALAAKANPALLEVMNHLVIALRQKPLEVAVRDTVVAYLATLASPLVSVGEDLLERALQAVLKHPVDFDLTVDIEAIDQGLLLRQVSFQLNIMEASPPPSKTAERIAAELREAIETLPNRPSPLNVTTGQQGNLSVSSPFTSQRQPVQGDEQAPPTIPSRS